MFYVSIKHMCIDFNYEGKGIIMAAILNRKVIFSAIVALSAALTTSIVINPAVAAPIEAKGSVELSKLLAPGKEKDMSEGSETAPVTIVEYASVTCSHCADFYINTLPAIREKYIKTGKVRLIFREFAFEPRATAGFMLARCLPEDRYFPFVQVLFEKQAEWAFVQDSLPPLRHLAAMAGLDEKSFNACLQNQTILEGVNSAQKAGEAFGVTATPTFFINGKKYEGAYSVDEMSSLIDSFL